jgi:hypothetical protein
MPVKENPKGEGEFFIDLCSEEDECIIIA